MLAYGSGQLSSCDAEATRHAGARRQATTAGAAQPRPAAAEQPRPSSNAPVDEDPRLPAAAPSAAAAPPFTVEPARCSRGDRSCLPVPYSVDVDATKYRPNAKRYPLDESASDSPEASCEHDGDCLRASCDDCVSRWQVPAGRTCVLRLSQRSPSYCGCVENRCHWFTQTLSPRTISSIEGLKLQLSGKAVADGKVLERTADVLMQQLDLAPCYLRFKELLPVRHAFVVTTLGRYGVTEARVSGAIPRLKRCIDDAFAKLLFSPSEISESFSNSEELRVSGVAKVHVALRP